ncbi:hypothetical protein L484_024510 [Morus notabilis]|uniref:Uncharacterized protein n=1 Tax=Morus notabilis TaxID=981085 RepID=W9RHZ8_9ROSA|nr:hypothetical protein L484_024510 [Morus notabilis]
MSITMLLWNVSLYSSKLYPNLQRKSIPVAALVLSSQFEPPSQGMASESRGG